MFSKTFRNSFHCQNHFDILTFLNFIELISMFHGILSNTLPPGRFDASEMKKEIDRRHRGWFLTEEFRD